MIHSTGRGLTGVLREERAARAVNNFLADRHVGEYRWRRDQADACHHGVYWCNESQAVEPLDAQGVCRTQRLGNSTPPPVTADRGGAEVQSL